MRPLFTILVATAFIATSAKSQSAYTYFDGNNVEAIISAHGNHFWDFNTNHFKVPATGEASSIFTATLWFGAKDE